MAEIGTMRVKGGLAEMLKGGVIMDVTTAEQARIAEEAGAVAVMALERVPADIRREGGVARMADPDKIREIQETVTIPVMAKARIGHFVEAQVLEALEVDYIDESEVLTPADTAHHIDKWTFTIPFVCGCTNLGEALRRLAEGAAMIRTKGEAGTGDIVNAVTHMRAVFGGIRRLGALDPDELFTEAKTLQAPVELVRWVAENGRLPVVTFTAGGIATPADAALCMQLGADGVFVGSGIFKSSDPERRAKAIVEATTHFRDDDHAPDAPLRPGRGAALVRRSRARDVRRDDRPRPQPPGPRRRRGGAKRLRPPGRELRGRPALGRRGRAATGRLHSRPPGARRGSGGRGARGARRRARPGAAGTLHRRLVPPGADRRHPRPRAFPGPRPRGVECPGIASGRRSSTRRAPPTHGGGSSSPSSRARSSSPGGT